MIQSSITISLVPEARGGPFVFWDDLAGACREAKAMGFDAVEVFPPGPGAVSGGDLRAILDGEGLALAAVGTGAGWVKHRLSLTAGERAIRGLAGDFVRGIVDAAGALGAPAILGSMQGRFGEGVDRESAAGWLAEALDAMGTHARQYGVPFLYEPLNRYETNMANTVEAGRAMIGRSGSSNVRLLADLFHMNIEERDIADAVRGGGDAIGHVHFVDSNRRAAGAGHLDFGPIAAALREVGYAGYASAEALPIPDPVAAARLTIESFRRHFGD